MTMNRLGIATAETITALWDGDDTSVADVSLVPPSLDDVYFAIAVDTATRTVPTRTITTRARFTFNPNELAVLSPRASASHQPRCSTPATHATPPSTPKGIP